jgi:hypothetical protein
MQMWGAMVGGRRDERQIFCRPCLTSEQSSARLGGCQGWGWLGGAEGRRFGNLVVAILD